MKYGKFYYLGLFLIGTGIALYFGTHSSRKLKTAAMQFHPDSIVKFEMTSKNYHYSFHRKSRSETWRNEKDEEQAGPQEILNALSSSETITGADVNGIVKVKIGFSDEQSWEGEFNGSVFAWKTGLLKNQSIENNILLNGFLSQGKFSFQSKNFYWCKNRPKKITIKVDDKNLTIEKKNLKWVANSNFEINPTQFEQWLSSSCELKIDYFYDIDLFGRPKASTNESFSVEFADNSKFVVERKNSLWFPTGGEFGYSSKHWENSILRLRKMASSL